MSFRYDSRRGQVHFRAAEAGGSPGAARPGVARPGAARPGAARRGPARPGAAAQVAGHARL